MPKTAFLIADVIGSKALSEKPGGHAEIEQLCREMRNFLDAQFKELNRDQLVSIKRGPSHGDDVQYRFKGKRKQSIADISVGAVIAALTTYPSGKRFRYVVHEIDSSIDYQPRIKFFAEISKTYEGKRHHIALDRALGSALSNSETIAWLRNTASTSVTLPLKGEPFSAGYMDLYVIVDAADLDRDTWVTISYGNLLDPAEITRTGENLTSVLQAPWFARGDVQPFVDRFSYLLPIVFEMLSGPGTVPQSSIIDLFPCGKSEPAWVAIVRGGRIHIATDAKQRAQVFLIGDDPKAAYLENYSVVRHCLAALKDLTEGDLRVDVFAYTNNYRDSELSLNLTPYLISEATFSSNKQRPLDLEELADFLAKGPELRFGILEQGKGLSLGGAKGAEQNLCGDPVELSDLAVAYRAMVHAGDNHAFVSLDPHRDCTMTKVNFGGFLENTRLGAVILEADKRFKTISCGLDPRPPVLDVRSATRTTVSGFLTSAERDLLRDEPLTQNWIHTRFWYYPDRLIEGDHEKARIDYPHFTADAERGRDDFASQEEYERHKRKLLWPSHKENIRDLNDRYADYALAFPELSELDAAARLFGICRWLFDVRPSWLDCDELLTVEVPYCKTETERTRLISSTRVSYSEIEAKDHQRVCTESQVVYLTPLLDETVEKFFLSADGIMDYLRGNGEVMVEDASGLETEAMIRFTEYKHRKVREILRNKSDLESFANYASSKIQVQPTPLATDLATQIAQENDVVAEMDGSLVQHRKEAGELQERIDALKGQMDDYRKTDDLGVSAEDLDEYEQLRSEHNQLVNQLNRVAEEHNRLREECLEHARSLRALRERLSTLRVRSTGWIDISGGISIGPSDFNFRRVTSSEALIALKDLNERITTEYIEIPTQAFQEKWIRSARHKRESAELAKKPDISSLKTRAAQIERFQLAVGSPGSWRVTIKVAGNRLTEKFYHAGKRELLMEEVSARTGPQTIIGQIETQGRVVFRKVNQDDCLSTLKKHPSLSLSLLDKVRAALRKL